MNMVFQVLVASTILVITSAEQCTTPNNEIAQCISLYSCPTIIKAIAAREPMSTEFVRLSNCGGNGSNPLVCCGSSSNFTAPRETVPKEPITPTNSRNLFPDKRICGYQHSDDYFRPDTKNAGINEFPWLALLFYKDAEGIVSSRCGGSLITDRYILAAAHCVAEPAHRLFHLSGIRLGDLIIQNRTDCEDALGLQECSDPPEDFDIEETVVHPNYTFRPRPLNDIALIRLNRTVTYSDYIRPICLPFCATVVAQVGDTLQSSVWGRLSTDRMSDGKNKIHSTLISNEECIRINHDIGVRFDITENQFCTEDSDENDECLGDSGGPLMFSNKLQWHQEGIYSYGSGICRKSPAIYTKVRNYMCWIQENVKP